MRQRAHGGYLVIRSGAESIGFDVDLLGIGANQERQGIPDLGQGEIGVEAELAVDRLILVGELAAFGEEPADLAAAFLAALLDGGIDGRFHGVTGRGDGFG